MILHLLTPSEWDAAQRAGSVAPSSLATEGFVHCSTPEQVEGTIARHFPGVEALVLLELDDARFGDDLRWEESRPGEVYPHLYRAIELDEVLGTVAWPAAPPGQ